MYKYCTYKFYDKTGRRLAAFAEETDNPNELKVLIFSCSRKDYFSKKKAKELYDRFNFKTNDSPLPHPIEATISVIPTQSKKGFLTYMRENYYTKVYMEAGILEEVLVKVSDTNVFTRFKGAKLIKPKLTKIYGW